MISFPPQYSASVQTILDEFDNKQRVPGWCSYIADMLIFHWLAETFFDFFSASAEWILMKLDRKQFLKALYHVCDFLAIHKSKMAALASDWLKHFSTSSRQLLNGFWWILKLADRKSKMAALASDLLKHFSTSPQPLNGFWRNLTGNKSSTSSTKFVFFSCRSEIQDGHPGLWLAETFFDFSTTVEWILTKLDRKQILNTLYQVCVFRAEEKMFVVYVLLGCLMSQLMIS